MTCWVVLIDRLSGGQGMISKSQPFASSSISVGDGRAWVSITSQSNCLERINLGASLSVQTVQGSCADLPHSEALRFGSESITRADPSFENRQPSAIDVVVLATPPLKEATEMIGIVRDF